MTLPLDTLAAVAGIVAGVTGLSWLAYEFAPALIESLGPEPTSDWSESVWGDVANVPDDLFHNGTHTR
jgi:hypothetical protein